MNSIKKNIQKYENKVIENNKIVNKNKKNTVLTIEKLKENDLIMEVLTDLNECMEELEIDCIKNQQKIDYILNYKG